MNLKETLLEVKSEFTNYFKEREAEINGSLLAVLSGENLLFLGPPGTAKTQLARGICQTIEGGNFFNYLLTSFSTPEEIFGPLSLKALEADEFRRNINGCLPTAHVALLDEIFKASSAILNSLLTILNERKYHNGREIADVPLLSVFGASNELPEEDESLEALYDRFLFRYRLSYIQDDENFKNLLFREPDDFKPAASIQVSEIEKLRKSSNSLPVDPDVEVIITELRKNLQLQEIEISDRRWKRIVQVLKVAACSSGCPAVDRTMILLLQHMLWNLPEERETIRKTVFKLVVSGGVNTEKLRLDAEDLKTALNIDLKNELPVGVICDSCGEEFQLREKLELHHTACPNHSYKLKQEGNSRIHPYKNLVREIDYLHERSGKKNTLSQGQREVFEKEFETLVGRVNRVKQRLEEEKELLRNLMDANIWLSTPDRNEALLLHDAGSTQLSGTEALIGEIETLLGLQHKKSRSEEFRAAKSGYTDPSDSHTSKIGANVQVPDSGNSAGGFMKGIGSRFKLR
ncbi:MoxR-related protein [Methanosarcina siciliae T4/M]|uniref:MoxR-related protein n=1 Tax=Methanosarcina siciliae T4/M TaxID=1434120 RepID=A0A0E3L8V2_9EURY|nr:AAA family ATPase [Methanosarcina siciliae]AKB29166.1 MoxR-related protein [Methanosarcina siciliae T4/M]